MEPYQDIRGKGLVKLDQDLGALAENPELLERARLRFTKSPPFRFYDSSSEISLSAVIRTQEELRRDEKGREVERLQSKARVDWIPTGQQRPSLERLAEEKVKMRWIEQGIWRDDTSPKQPTAAAKTKEMGQDQREREASRPFYQFVYQVSKEREWIEEEEEEEEGTIEVTTRVPAPCPANPFSYGARETPAVPEGRVKATWVKWGIWDAIWGVLPGMTWKHERPFEEVLQEELDNDAAQAEDSGIGNAESFMARASPAARNRCRFRAYHVGRAKPCYNQKAEHPRFCPAETGTGGQQPVAGRWTAQF
ncbi:hypothetical protein C8A03DRAFT_38533 [Achaetomium macrosporum]|uniref:Uncharacterized protein n=1 Tax=Achaetomium macrosporum TaxID=79813 RepID=A0AAN7C2C3_9PEZI|nr:hypothetical protein C8A03DRAFT_38533 [Achaetomium macrosporum]